MKSPSFGILALSFSWHTASAFQNSVFSPNNKYCASSFARNQNAMKINAQVKKTQSDGEENESFKQNVAKNPINSSNQVERNSRRSFLNASTFATFLAGLKYSNPAFAVDVDGFLQSGMVSQPMGVSGQAGKSRPETGVFLRDGSEVSRNEKTGDVLAEIVLNVKSDSPTAVVTSFSSPWPLAKGSLFDVECRDSKTGDGAFLAVSSKLQPNANLADIPSNFFINQLFSPTGRFSFYGSPTDIKVKKSRMVTDNYRLIDVSFSSLSQSTMTEIPRNALVAITVPEGTSEAVMLVGSASALRWKKGSEEAVRKTAESFRAIPAPKSNLKIRAKNPTEA